MQECKRCGLKIAGDKTSCPLCGASLFGSATDEVFPPRRDVRLSRLIAIRICAFIGIAFLVAVFIIDNWLFDGFYLFPFAALMTLVGFADICMITYCRSNPLRVITWQVYIALLTSLLIDYRMGWKAWSVVWVLPAAFLGMMIVIVITGNVLKMTFRNCVLYLLLDAILSMSQLIFVALGLNPFRLPAVISMGFVVVFFAGVLIFRWQDFREAGSRYFNI